MPTITLDLPTRALLSLAHHNAQDALKRFVLLNGDVEGATLSFRLFEDLRQLRDPAHNTAIMYHASCFICAVRRVGRLLKSLSDNRTCFRDPVAEVVRLEWRKKRAFFESFVDPRNAIEHIDNEASDNTRWSFFNLHEERLCVVDGVSVEINQRSLDTIVSARNVVAESITKEYHDAMFDFLEAATSI